MENKFTVTEKQLAFLEDYLKQKKRHLEPEDLYELMDHLVTDFEHNGNGNISEYLANNSNFIFKYKGSNVNKEKVIHWSYQRHLWVKFFSFFTSIKLLPITILLIFLIKKAVFTFSIKVLFITFILLTIIPTVLALIKQYHKKREVRKLIEFKYLANIMALPHMFMYALSQFKSLFSDYKWFFVLYLSLGIGLTFAGYLLIVEKRKIILEKYKHLLN